MLEARLLHEDGAKFVFIVYARHGGHRSEHILVLHVVTISDPRAEVAHIVV